MKNRIIISVLSVIIGVSSCTDSGVQLQEGKVHREVISFAPKITGRVIEIYIEEGDVVKKGDTLALLDVPEAEAKKVQIQGAVKAAEAQRTMADNGATTYQLRQLQAKTQGLQEQFLFAQRSYERAVAMAADSMIAPQAFEEIQAKFQGAKTQLEAAEAELKEAETGVRYEKRMAMRAQEDQARGALQEVQITLSERYIIATNDMLVETITLHEGELAVAGYPLFSGYVPNAVYFRFTLPEHAIKNYQPGDQVVIEMPYLEQKTTGRVKTIKQLTRYANITAAYPEFQLEEAVYEIKVKPVDLSGSTKWLTNATAILH